MWDLRTVNFDKFWGVKSVLKFHMLIILTCEELVPIPHTCEELVPVFHTREELVPVSHTREELVPIFHTCWISTNCNQLHILPEEDTLTGVKVSHPDLSAPPGTLFPPR